MPARICCHSTWLLFLSCRLLNSKELSVVHLVVEFTRAGTSTKILSMKTEYSWLAEVTMTTPFISVTAAILYFGWLWHNRSAVDRRKENLERAPTKKTSRTREPFLARRAAAQTPGPKFINLKSRATVFGEGIAQ